MSREPSKSAMEKFGKHCEFSKDGCPCTVGTQDSFVLFTNVWNEEPSIRPHFKRVLEQPFRPSLWVWLDDGSTDSSYNEMLEASTDYPIEVIVVRNKMKKRPNYLMLGKGHQLRLDTVRSLLSERGIVYMTNLDVDTTACPNYFGRMLSLLESDPLLGVAAGYPVGEWNQRIASEPMHSGKFVRWKIVRRIKKLWDTCPDTQYNIKARAFGYKTKVFRVPLYHEGPTAGLTEVGAERLGQIAYYAGRPFWAQVLRSLRRSIVRQHGTALLRGWLKEWIRGTWHCEDEDVVEHFKESPLTTLKIYMRGKSR
ncbi:MAG: glycosyltransferase family 2 protein [Candidatus Thorarchaeota archaeon]|nr:glycosyltransferase family 2 protein [Candidatus Thorarchaeota archaeon]